MKLNCVLKISYLLSILSFAFFFIIHFCLLFYYYFLPSTFSGSYRAHMQLRPCDHFQYLSKMGGEAFRLTWSRSNPKVNLQFLKLVKVLHISLLPKVDLVQVFVYISYHPYVFICILRLFGFICMLLVCIRMYPHVSLCYSYVPVRCFSQS